ncbi:SagB/ThcOx family dehydrogenase [Romeria aff. gracilis LEGE 07310]|uniref:SagB/ThcOx family dehydrogenase n=1 Tax=Vasconcelosia minhoensis LEGE 07310 TaxID=915328 RepID=A0A8J7AGK4_9CYAN|nr:SagB/ThcOx family dehydrogenase [Romeria gracilis]MBE9077158.1 SagB/ThcOx family dehydrogenase [Romeria aff. gracilis LEGE 07310]
MADSIAQHYHQRTKYDPQTIANKGRQLDWSKQPVPYKDYKLGFPVDLKPYLEKSPAAPAERLWWQRLSRLLVNSYGLTAKVMTMTAEPLYLRAAPSAGGLYPAEIYLISRGTSLLPAGLYNYQVRTHTLLRFWDDYPWQALQEGCFWHPSLENTQLALVISAVFYRSVWRYEDRAYRRIFLDTGHLLGNLELAGSLCDYRPHLIGGFADDAVNQLLYLDRDQEGVIAIAALADQLQVAQNLPLAPTVLPAPVQTQFPKLADGELLPYFHQVTQIAPDDRPPPRYPISPADDPAEPIDKYDLPFCLKISTQSSSIPWGEGLAELEQTLLTRRSTRRYTGDPLTQAELLALLDFTYHPEHLSEQGFDAQPDYFDLSLIQTFIAVSGVDSLEPGCYHYAPQAEELRQIRFKQFRQELHFLCLGQELGRDAGAVVFHTANLAQAVERYGDRAYRYLHMDAGHLGQRLNLAAVRLGLGVSGIAGFFDDQVNEVLGIPEDEAVLYITTLGKPWKSGS